MTEEARAAYEHAATIADLCHKQNAKLDTEYSRGAAAAARAIATALRALAEKNVRRRNK